MTDPYPTAHAPFDLDGVDPDLVSTYHLDRLPLNRPITATSDLLRLDGKVAVVTGGGGSGLGNAVCHRLAEQGAAVGIVDVDLAAGTRSAEDLRATWGVDAFAVEGNVADWQSARTAIGELGEHFGTIDILVNNAGGSGSVGAGGERLSTRGYFESMAPGDMEVVVGVNFFGVLNMTHAALEPMRAAGRGRIINIASEGGKFGAAGLAVYSSCKAAVISLTANLAHELGPQGISIAAVCPGTLVSPRLLSKGYLSLDLDDIVGRTFQRTSIGRISLPDEVASMVAFLASDAGSYVHGTAVSVGGGVSD